MAANAKTLVIQGGTLIDGSGGKPKKNECLVIEGNRIKSIGAKPKGLNLANRGQVEVIDATGQWVMPGLIDAHVHLSFGHPNYPGIGRGTISAEFSTLRTAMNAQAVLRAGVTSVSVPGGAWFSDVAVREAINGGLLEGPRIFCAGRLMSVLGGGGDREPHWVGTPDHAISKLCHGADEMVAEVRRQAKH
ncbi:MAG: amidohydrolase family protein, partial [Proteobacteria bacterium]|nr:amidohydrolase family protein [Pseudomonadota bacterium]